MELPFVKTMTRCRSSLNASAPPSCLICAIRCKKALKTAVSFEFGSSEWVTLNQHAHKERRDVLRPHFTIFLFEMFVFFLTLPLQFVKHGLKRCFVATIIYNVADHIYVTGKIDNFIIWRDGEGGDLWRRQLLNTFN